MSEGEKRKGTKTKTKTRRQKERFHNDNKLSQGFFFFFHKIANTKAGGDENGEVIPSVGNSLGGGFIKLGFDSDPVVAIYTTLDSPCLYILHNHWQKERRNDRPKSEIWLP